MDHRTYRPVKLTKGQLRRIGYSNNVCLKLVSGFRIKLDCGDNVYFCVTKGGGIVAVTHDPEDKGFEIASAFAVNNSAQTIFSTVIPRLKKLWDKWEADMGLQ
ncbi:MAG: hypothetical protein ACYS7Y_31055 [Planctomycetota bacterium]|jgi:hypothetical protein